MPSKQPKFARGIRKYIRNEKARIRREVDDVAKQYEMIGQLVKRFRPAEDVGKLVIGN